MVNPQVFPQEKQSCFPNPRNPDLKMQSVIAPGADWGSSAHRFPNYVDGEATWPAQLLADIPGRCTTYESFQTTVAENPDRPYLGERKVVHNEDGSTSVGDYEFINFLEASDTATLIGSGLKSLGISKNQTVGLYSKNRKE